MGNEAKGKYSFSCIIKLIVKGGEYRTRDKKKVFTNTLKSIKQYCCR